MPDPKFKISDVQPWYQRAQSGDIQNPYTFEGMGADQELKAQFIKEKVLPLFVKDVYERVQMGDQWDADWAKKKKELELTAGRGAPTGPTPEYGGGLPGTVGESDELLQRLLSGATPIPGQ